MNKIKNIALITIGFVLGLLASNLIYEHMIRNMSNNLVFGQQQIKKMHRRFEELVQLDDVKLTQHLLETMLDNYKKE